VQRTTATWARTVGFIQLEDLLDHWQLRLLGRPRLRARFGISRLSGRLVRRSIGGLLRLLRQRFDQGQRLLQLLAAPFQLRELLAFACQGLEQVFDLNLLGQRDAAKLLDVLLASQIHRSTISSISEMSIPSITFFAAGLSRGYSAPRAPARELGGRRSHVLR
jgi:hypothetical protein